MLLQHATASVVVQADSWPKLPRLVTACARFLSLHVSVSCVYMSVNLMSHHLEYGLALVLA